MLRFGITERGDIAFDNNWIKKLKGNEVQAAILISKGLPTKPGAEAMRELKDKIIFHATTTGYGSTIVEPNVMPYEKRLENLKGFCEAYDFPANHIVIRVDPIIPTEKGLALAQKVISKAQKLGFSRFRFSFIDVYKHVVQRFQKAGLPVPPGIKEADPKEITKFYTFLNKKQAEGLVFESCAESDEFQTGCISEKDFELCGISKEELAIPQHRQRQTCLCCGNKTELLTRKQRCPHQCLYCYWID